MIKPRTPPGVLELLPREQIAFQRMLDTIRRTFERYGFLPVETPVMELTEVLLTKTGGETERQVYFMQSTGSSEQAREELAKTAMRVSVEALAAKGLPIDINQSFEIDQWYEQMEKAANKMPEMAMRFDLTVPLARYVAEHEHDLVFPFRRYQMQRVYRGERAQRGRFREFYQCDIDVIGKDALSPRYDAELPAVIASVFEALAIGEFTIQFNHRKLLRGFFEGQGIADGNGQAAVLREIDKLDKRGEAAVRETLVGEGFGLSGEVADTLLAFSRVRAVGHDAAQAALDGLGEGTPLFEEGRAELREVLRQLRALGVADSRFALNLSIARGLDYYTGIVYETTLNANPEIGSICSGGRYENLASHYTKSKLPGVGISIGLTRLFWQLREAGLVDVAESSVDVLVSLMDEAGLEAALSLSQRLRAAGLNVETQLEARKFKKQMEYANKAGIRFVVIRGEDEAAKGVVAVKDLRRGEQFEVAEAELARTLLVEREQLRALS